MILRVFFSRTKEPDLHRCRLGCVTDQRDDEAVFIPIHSFVEIAYATLSHIDGDVVIRDITARFMHFQVGGSDFHRHASFRYHRAVSILQNQRSCANLPAVRLFIDNLLRGFIKHDEELGRHLRGIVCAANRNAVIPRGDVMHGFGCTVRGFANAHRKPDAGNIWHVINGGRGARTVRRHAADGRYG